MRKKVLLISESVAGGLRKHLVQLIDNLDQEKFEIYFIHGTGIVDKKFEERYDDLKKKCTIIICKDFTRNLNLRKDLSAFLFLVKEIRNIRPDIVHCHSSKAGALGRVAARLCGIEKILYTPHAYAFLADEFSSRKKYLFLLIERFLNKFSKCTTLNVSNGEKKGSTTK